MHRGGAASVHGLTFRIPYQQPEVMIAAIEDVVQAVREPSSWATPEAGTPVP